MKRIYIPLFIIVFFTSFFLVLKGFSYDKNIKQKTVIAKRRGRRGGVRFRFYVGPRYRYYRRGYYYRDYGYNYNQVTINIKENPSQKERILDAHIDGYRINLRPPSSSGSRGSYSYRLRSGYHEIEWTLQYPRKKTETFYHSFYIDRYNRYTNILIDGSQIFIN